MAGTNATERLADDAGRSIPASQLLVKGQAEGSAPRFELYHSTMSLCSQKVRSVLAFKAVPYTSYDLVIICHRDASGFLHSADNYDPAYVRLRMAGSETPKYARGWTGVTAVSTEGFDACVVPTLVDRATGEVVVDSLRIVEHIERVCPEDHPLVPKSPVAARNVRRQVEIVDQTPHGALLAGFHPDDDRRPDALKAIMLNYHVDKREVLERLIRENAADEDLVRAYRAKIEKEDVGERVCHDGKLMREARDATIAILTDLERDLASARFPSHSPDVTLADLMWGVSLVRMKYLGLGELWSNMPNVERYLQWLLTIPAVRSEAIDATISSLPPSLYL